MTLQKRSWNPLVIILLLSSVFFVVFMMISGSLFLTKGSGPVRGGGSSALFGGDSVGVLEIEGVILDSKKVLSKLERLEEDDQIKAVVLRLNSPGGAVAPSQEIYEAILKFKKPLVVSMASVAASGAYYIACAAKKVFANPGTLTGSIGVIMEFANLQKLYDWAKIERYSVKTGKFKDAGAEYRAMTDEERGLFQGMVDDILMQFKKAVANGRNLTMAQVTAIADGRVFSGHQAKEFHLVDELGTLQDAIHEAGKQAGIKGKPSVIYIDKTKKKWFDILLDDSSSSSSSESSLSLIRGLSSLLRLVSLLEGSHPVSETVPGVYWLWGRGSTR